MESSNKIAKQESVTIELAGYPVRMKLVCKDPNNNDSVLMRSLLVQELVKRGIFMHPGVEYVSFSHEKEDIQNTIRAFSDAILIIKKALNENKLESYLEGKPAKAVYSVIKPSEKKYQ